jgi:hypothetical protein
MWASVGQRYGVPDGTAACFALGGGSADRAALIGGAWMAGPK